MIGAQDERGAQDVRATGTHLPRPRERDVGRRLSPASEPAAARVRSRRIRNPVRATLAARTSMATGSRAAAAPSSAWARATKGTPRPAGGMRSAVADGAVVSSFPVQISAATSSSDRERASAAASRPR